MSASAEIAEQESFQPSSASGMAFAVGFFFSFRAVITLFCVRVLGIEPSVGTAFTIALGMILLAFVCLQSLGPGIRTISSTLRLPSGRWVLAFLLFSVCSLAWSRTISPATSFTYWLGMAADVAMVVLLLRTESIAQVSSSLMKGFIWSTCFLALAAWIMPAQSDLRLGDEDFFNANQIGNLCAFSLFLAQYLMRRKDGKWGLAATFLILTLIRSLSKTTIAAFLVGEIVLVIHDRSMSRRSKVLLTTATVFLILVFWGLFEAYYNLYTTSGNQAETLTGRTAIWAYTLDEALKEPLIGNGFDAMWKVFPLFGGGFEARHAENELLQQFFAYGAVGIIMLAGLYGSLYRQLKKLQQGPVRIVFSSLLLFTLIRGLAEAEPFDLLLPLWLIVLIAALISSENPTPSATATVQPAIASVALS